MSGQHFVYKALYLSEHFKVQYTVCLRYLGAHPRIHKAMRLCSSKPLLEKRKSNTCAIQCVYHFPKHPVGVVFATHFIMALITHKNCFPQDPKRYYSKTSDSIQSCDDSIQKNLCSGKSDQFPAGCNLHTKCVESSVEANILLGQYINEKP